MPKGYNSTNIRNADWPSELTSSLSTGASAINLLNDFTTYLAEHGVSLNELSRQESSAITKRWTSVFATQDNNLHQTIGPKAVAHWLSAKDDHLILLFLSAKITTFPISQNSRPCTAHLYSGPIIDLSNYNELEFAVFPDSYAWTLIHTHEDNALGGPYFIRNEDVEQ